MATPFVVGANLPKSRRLKISWTTSNANDFAGYSPSVVLDGAYDLIETATSGNYVYMYRVSTPYTVAGLITSAHPEWGLEWKAVCGDIGETNSCFTTKYFIIDTHDFTDPLEITSVNGISETGLAYEDIDNSQEFVEGELLPASPSLKILWDLALDDWPYDNANPFIGTTPPAGHTTNYFTIESYEDVEDKAIRHTEWTYSDTLYNNGYNSLCGLENDSSCSTYKFFVIDTYGWTDAQRTLTDVMTVQVGWTGLRYEDLATWDVTFDSNGGTSVAGQTVDNYAKISEPADPTKTGHTLVGWYSDEALTDSWNFSTDEVNADTTLYAKWSINEWTLTYDVNGGSAKTPDTYDYDETLVAFTDPTKADHEFDGWYYDEDTWESPVTFGTDKMPNNDLTIYAKWLEIFTVTFDVDGGSAVANQDITDGSLVEEPDIPTKSGYLFSGWFSDAGLTSSWDFDEDTISADTTIYAKWSALGSIGISDDLKDDIMDDLFGGIGTDVWYINLVDSLGEELTGTALEVTSAMDLSTTGTAVLSGEYEFEVPGGTTISSVKLRNDAGTETVTADLAAPVAFASMGYYVVLSLTITLG
jgi:uncharacterized repeat protein (TIGR02543 family)